MPNYKVKQGDSLESIARDFGHLWPTIWDAPENEDLRKRRQEPELVWAGDIVFVPEINRRTERAATGEKHKFKRKVRSLETSAILRVDLLVDPTDATARDDRFILTSDDESYEVSYSIADDKIPGDRKVTLEFQDLERGKSYSLVHDEGADGFVYSIFSDRSYEDLFFMSEQGPVDPDLGPPHEVGVEEEPPPAGDGDPEGDSSLGMIPDGPADSPGAVR